MNFEKVAVIGLGYIGLPTAAAIATQRVKVLGVDIDADIVATINDGRIHIVEPELDVAVHAAVTRGYLKASLECEPADAFLIAVPTPFKANHEPDLKYIEQAAKTIAPHLVTGNLVVLESTSPVGTTEKLSEWLSALRPDLTFPHVEGDAADIRVAHCPERVLPGKVMYELANNDRIIGGLTETCSSVAKQLYEVFVHGECLTTNSRTAELCKLTENATRDVNIALANELSVICDKLDINVWELISLANRHPRINILQPGPGVGGHCIAVDPWFIISQMPEQARLMKTAREINDNKPHWVIDKVNASIQEFLKMNPGKTVSDVTIACFGLAFKADIDDLRESPALDITAELQKQHTGKVVAIEPNIDRLPAQLESSGLVLESTEQALLSADIYVLLVDHQEFRKFNPKLAGKICVDTRGVWI